jgi:alkaline phosphatase D
VNNTPSLAGGTFRTLPQLGRSARFRFALGGDLIESMQPFSILDRVLEWRPDFTILLGDLVYSDSPLAIPPTVEAYRAKYRANWSDASFRRLTSTVPSFTMWDDHEIVNDYDGGDSERYRAARAALEEYVTCIDPLPLRPGRLYFTFGVADVEFFVLDTRSHRSRNASADSDGKTMLGSEQKADLKAWLKRSQAQFKVILSSVAMHGFGQVRLDSWNGFTSERKELLEFIGQQKISDVVVLSGDQHWGSLALHAPYGVWEFNATPLAQYLVRAAPMGDPRLVLAYDSSTVFGLVDVDTTLPRPTMTFSIVDNQGQIRASHTIEGSK